MAVNLVDFLLDNIPDMVFVKDSEDLRFVQFNKAAEDLLGHTREEMIGKNDYDFFPKHEADFFTGKDWEVFKSKRLLNIPEESIQTKHKGVRYLHTKKIPIIDEQGKPLYLLGISEDITERKRAEEALEDLTKNLEDRIIERTQQLRSMATELNLAEQQERKRLAAELLGRGGGSSSGRRCGRR